MWHKGKLRRMGIVSSKGLVIMDIRYARYWELRSRSMFLIIQISFILWSIAFFCFGVILIFLFFHSIVDFFKELHQFVVKAGPTLSNVYGADWENRLEVLVWQQFMPIIKKYCLNMCLFIWALIHGFVFIFLQSGKRDAGQFCAFESTKPVRIFSFASFILSNGFSICCIINWLFV